MGEKVIMKSREEKDLGVIIQDTLTPERHISEIFGSTYRMLMNIRVAFHYMDKAMMKKIITTMIRPKLEYEKRYNKTGKDSEGSYKDGARTERPNI